MREFELSSLEIFIAVARVGSVRGAARGLGTTPSVVSRRLSLFESQLGVILFLRNNRSLTLTETGEVLFERAITSFDMLRAAVQEAGAKGNSKSGVLKISLPWSAYKIVVAPTLKKFRHRYPDISLQFSFEEGLIDIVQHGFHAGFRLGDRLSQGVVATRVTPRLDAAYFASTAYLSEFGVPHHPSELAQHQCIHYRYVKANRLASWEFKDGDTKLVPKLGAGLTFDTFQAVIEAAVDGHGIGWALKAVVAEYIDRGDLVPVLESHTTDHPPFYIYYPEQLTSYPPLRLFIDFIVSETRR